MRIRAGRRPHGFRNRCLQNAWISAIWPYAAPRHTPAQVGSARILFCRRFIQRDASHVVQTFFLRYFRFYGFTGDKSDKAEFGSRSTGKKESKCLFARKLPFKIHWPLFKGVSVSLMNACLSKELVQKNTFSRESYTLFRF